MVENKSIDEAGQPISWTSVRDNSASANRQIREQAARTGEPRDGLIRLDGRDAGNTPALPETITEWVRSQLPSPRESQVTRWVEVFYRNGDGQLVQLVMELEGKQFVLRSSEAVR